MDPHIGSEIAGYRLEALLGRGRNAIVYLAEDVRLNRQVALKLLSPERADDEQFREQFLRESRLATLLDHPGIVPVYEAGEADGRLYVAMAHVEGTDLASLLVQEGRLDPERALAVVTELADALDAARWGRGLVHGNLGPAEVLVAEERVLLTGFGERQELPARAGLGEAARHFDRPAYLAPEQIEGRPVSPRTDVYALGCLLFECLTGSPPFDGHSSGGAAASAPVRTAPVREAVRPACRNRPGDRKGDGEVARGALLDLRRARRRARRRPFARQSRSPRSAAARRSRLPAEPGVAQQTPSRRLGDGGGALSKRPTADGRLDNDDDGRRSQPIGLAALLALVAGAIWLIGRDHRR